MIISLTVITTTIEIKLINIVSNNLIENKENIEKNGEK